MFPLIAAHRFRVKNEDKVNYPEITRLSRKKESDRLSKVYRFGCRLGFFYNFYKLLHFIAISETRHRFAIGHEMGSKPPLLCWTTG
jgi:hypothetical protein